MAYKWLQSKCDGVKRFDTVIKKLQERDTSGKFKPAEDSYRSVAKFLSTGTERGARDNDSIGLSRFNKLSIESTVNLFLTTFKYLSH